MENPLSIKKIAVKKLFGHLNYSIPDTNGKDTSKLMILYGENGSGKTTILKLLFYLISSKDKSGYKTKLAKTKFAKLEVEFGNGLVIGAKRKANIFVGTFTYYLKQGTRTLKSVELKSTADLSINLEPGSKEDAKYQEILKLIKELNITIFYLSDDRKILNSTTSSDYEGGSHKNIYLSDSDIVYGSDYEKVAIKKYFNEKRVAVEPAVERLLDWIRNKTISGSKTGEKNSQVIFADIFRGLNKIIQSGIINKNKEQLLAEVTEIENEVEPFVSLGLIESFDSNTIKTSIKNVRDEEQLNYINILVSPFLESIKAKLKAFEQLQQTISLFLTTINQYYLNKRVHFNLNEGFTLLHDSNEKLEFGWLSSGEQQLLLLLINTITSAEKATMFIIDEPEISLNVKWQRKLINTLLEFSSNKNVQFIIATHSIELLSGNVNSVSRLVQGHVGK